MILIVSAVTVSAQLRLRPTQGGVLLRPGDNYQAIINANPAGTTFVFMTGTHRITTPLVPRSGDTYVGDKTQGLTRTSILTGARVLSGPWIVSGSRWYIAGQTQEQTFDLTNIAFECVTATHPRCIYPHDVFFNKAMKHHEANLADVGPGDWYFDYGADRIYVGDNPNGQLVETSATPYPFDAGATSNVTLRNLVIQMFASPNSVGVLFPQQGWLIDDNEIRWNHGGGIWMTPSSRARNNYLHHNCGYAITGAGSDILVDGNEIAYNNIIAGSLTETCGYDPFWGAGTKWVFTDGLIVRGNYSHHNNAPGLWTDIQNVDTLYENNLVTDNRRGGIFHELSCDAIIRNNWLFRNGQGEDYPGVLTGGGIEITASNDVEAYGNVLVENWQGITGRNDTRRGATGYSNCPVYGLYNLNVHNNHTTTGTRGDGSTGVEDAVDLAAFAANNHYENNTYILQPLPTLYFRWMNALQSDAGWVSFSNDESGSIVR